MSRWRGHIRVDVDIDDVLRELDDDDIREEFESRGLRIIKSYNDISGNINQTLEMHLKKELMYKVIQKYTLIQLEEIFNEKK